jgi:hypothetical protein
MDVVLNIEIMTLPIHINIILGSICFSRYELIQHDTTVELLFLKQVIRNNDDYREMLHLRRECQGRIHSLNLSRENIKLEPLNLMKPSFLVFTAKEKEWAYENKYHI